MGQVLYPTRDDQVIFVSFFFRLAALQMLAVALATSALCASRVEKINSPKFHLPTPSGVYHKVTQYFESLAFLTNDNFC